MDKLKCLTTWRLMQQQEGQQQYTSYPETYLMQNEQLQVRAHFKFGPLSVYLSTNYLDGFLAIYELPSNCIPSSFVRNQIKLLIQICFKSIINLKTKMASA